MKKTNIIVSLILLALVIFLVYQKFSNKDDNKLQLDIVNTELSDLKRDYSVMVQIDAKKDIVIDSSSHVITQLKIKLGEEREERYELKLELEAEIEGMIESTDEENVEYFIAATYQSYPVNKHVINFKGEYVDFYLINIASIRFANNAMVNIEYMEDENLSLINEIQKFEELVLNYDLKIKEYDNKFKLMNNMLDNRNTVIANMNVKYALQNSRIKKLKLTKNISLAALAAIVIFK